MFVVVWDQIGWVQGEARRCSQMTRRGRGTESEVLELCVPKEREEKGKKRRAYSDGAMIGWSREIG